MKTGYHTSPHGAGASISTLNQFGCARSRGSLCAMMLLVVAFLNASAAFAQNIGDALVLVVAGDEATYSPAPGDNFIPLTEGMKLTQGASIRTGEASSVSLVFTNGSNLTIRPRSTIHLSEVYQAAYDDSLGAYGGLDKDPSQGVTRIRMDAGEVLGEVRGLASDSVFEITSDVGTAGIRGTIFRVKLELDGSRVRMTVSNAEGHVIASSSNLGISPDALNDGTETVIEVDIDENTGEAKLISVSTDDIPAGDLAQIFSAVQAVTKESQTKGRRPARRSTGASGNNDDDGVDPENKEDLGDQLARLDDSSNFADDSNRLGDPLVELAARGFKNIPRSLASSALEIVQEGEKAGLNSDEIAEYIDDLIENPGNKPDIIEEIRGNIDKYRVIHEAIDNDAVFDELDTTLKDALLALFQKENGGMEVFQAIWDLGVYDAEFLNTAVNFASGEGIDLTALANLLIVLETDAVNFFTLVSSDLRDDFLNIYAIDADVFLALWQYWERSDIAGIIGVVNRLLGFEGGETDALKFLGLNSTTIGYLAGLIPADFDRFWNLDLAGADLEAAIAYAAQLAAGKLNSLLAILELFNNPLDFLAYSDDAKDDLIDLYEFSVAVFTKAIQDLPTDEGELRSGIEVLIAVGESGALKLLNLPEGYFGNLIRLYLANSETFFALWNLDLSDEDLGVVLAHENADLIANVVGLIVATRESGNEDILDIVFEIGEGLLNPDLIDAGLLVNTLASDATLTNGKIDTSRVWTRQQLIQSKYNDTVIEILGALTDNQEIASNILDFIENASPDGKGQSIQSLFGLNLNILDTHAIDGGDLFGLTTDDFAAYIGEDVTVSNVNVDVTDYLGSSGSHTVLAIASLDSLTIEGNVNFTNSSPNDANALGLVSAGSLNFASGSNLSYSGGHLGINARDSISLENGSISASAGSLEIGTLEDLKISNFDLNVGNGEDLFLFANELLEINDLRISRNVDGFFLEARTLILAGIDFTGNVTLRSELGAIDGYYPSFGNVMIGRVNFLNNVSYEGFLIMDRPSFDQFGGEIQIESYTGYVDPDLQGLLDSIDSDEFYKSLPRKAQTDLLYAFRNNPEDFQALYQIAQENMDLFEHMSRLENGVFNPDLIDAGILVHMLATDGTLTNGQLDDARLWNRQRLLESKYNDTVILLLGALSGNEEIAENIIEFIENEAPDGGGKSITSLTGVNSDLLGTRPRSDVGDLFGLTTDDFLVWFGNDIEIEDVQVDVTPQLGADAIEGKGNVLAIAATEDIRISGKVEFVNNQPNGRNAFALLAAHRLVVMENADISYSGGHFSMNAMEDMHLESASISAPDGSIQLGTLNNMTLKNVDIQGGDDEMLIAYADKEMVVDNLRISSDISYTHLEAQTLVISNTDFHGEVTLASELGGLDGKYPNFGSTAFGRVNFLENVSYDGNVMHDRPTFDEHGNRIEIIQSGSGQ